MVLGIINVIFWLWLFWREQKLERREKRLEDREEKLEKRLEP